MAKSYKFALLAAGLIYTSGLSAQIISTMAGNGGMGYGGDNGPALSATFYHPCAIARNAQTKSLYVADIYNNRVRKIDSNGVVTTVDSSSSAPEGLALDNAGNLYIGANFERRVYKVTPQGIRTLFAGDGSNGFSGDGGPAVNAGLASTMGVAADAAGNVYIADAFNNRIRKVDAAGIITTVAGNGANTYTGDGGPATMASMHLPSSMTIDASGNMYIADRVNSCIRMVNTAGIISTVAGTGAYGFSGDSGPAVNAQLNYPWSVAKDTAGNLYIADGANNRIRKVNAAGIITTIVGKDTAGFSGDGGLPTLAKINYPFGIALLPDGSFYFSDSYNDRIRFVGNAPAPAGVSNITVDDIVVYPNPVIGLLHIRKINNPKYKIVITDIVAKEYYSETILPGDQAQVNFTTWPSGVYLLKVQDEKGGINTVKINH